MTVGTAEPGGVAVIFSNTMFPAKLRSSVLQAGAKSNALPSRKGLSSVFMDVCINIASIHPPHVLGGETTLSLAGFAPAGLGAEPAHAATA